MNLPKWQSKWQAWHAKSAKVAVERVLFDKICLPQACGGVNRRGSYILFVVFQPVVLHANHFGRPAKTAIRLIHGNPERFSKFFFCLNFGETRLLDSREWEKFRRIVHIDRGTTKRTD